MKTVVINYFTGTKTVALSLNAAQYITLYDNASNDITDSNIISVNRYADSVVVSISSDNVLASAFPLRLVYFNYIPDKVYPSKYWRTPTNAEMSYILNSRPNASNLRTMGRVEVGSGTYTNGLFVLPDDWTLPEGVSMTITTANYTTNTYSISDFAKLEANGAVFFGCVGYRIRSAYTIDNIGRIWLGTNADANNAFFIVVRAGAVPTTSTQPKNVGRIVRLCCTSDDKHSFKTSASTYIKFAPANLQYHCRRKVWRFAENQYDYIGQANENISSSYNGWIDLFGYGTSGVKYSPVMTSGANTDYPNSDISNTENDWGVNIIQKYGYTAGEPDTSKLFDQAQATPAASDCFAIGKRNATAKNVSLSDLSDFITDSGDAYIKKASNLANIQAQQARENLSVYDKKYVDRIPSDFITSANDFSYTTTVHTNTAAVLCDSVDIDPASYEVTMYGADVDIHTYFRSSSVYVSLKFKQVGYISNYHFAEYHRICMTSALFHNMNISLPNAVIIPATMPKLPFTGDWQHVVNNGGESYEIVTDGTKTFANFADFPQVVITGDQTFVYRGGTYQPNSVYVVYPDMPTPQLSQWCSFNSPAQSIDITYETAFIPNDSQLN